MIERTFIEQGIRRVELEEFLRKQLYRAGFTKSEVIKTPLVTRIIVNVTNPGLAIGKSGQNIKSLTQEIGKKFKIDDPQLEIEEIKVPELNSAAMADKMKTLIEKGFSYRSVSYRVARDVMNAGAQGVELLLKGKLAGKGGRKRKLRIAEGYMKKVGHQAKLVDSAKATAYPKAGAIGISIRIVRPETVFPDKIRIADFVKEEESKETEAGKDAEEEEGKEKGKEVIEKTEEIKETLETDLASDKGKPAEETSGKEITELAEEKKETESEKAVEGKEVKDEKAGGKTDAEPEKKDEEKKEAGK